MKSMRFSVMLLLVAMQFISLSISGGAMAAPMEWTLNGVMFDDGGIASGTFTYDADTNLYANWNISVLGSTNPMLPDFTYQPTNAYPGDPWLGEVGSLSNSNWVDFVCNSALPYSSLGRYLQLSFGDGITGLTNAGGIVTLMLSNYSFEEAPSWPGIDPPTRYITTGSVSTIPPSSTPEPATMLLLGTGLVGLAGFRRNFFVK